MLGGVFGLRESFEMLLGDVLAKRHDVLREGGDVQITEVQHIGMAIGCSNHLALRRGCRGIALATRRGSAPEGRSRSAVIVSVVFVAVSFVK